MGILNVTPDSFFAQSCFKNEKECVQSVEQMLIDGADIIDIGGVSTRPFANEVSTEEEIHRLSPITKAIRNRFPKAIISIDTWRSKVVQALADDGIDIINDISGGQFDPLICKVVANYKLAYILMHTNGTPQVMQQNPTYENLMNELFLFFTKQLGVARKAGINDLIIDPGFGFGKTLAHNVKLMQNLDEFRFLGVPLLVGISRKSLIYKTLQKTPEEALNGSTVLHTLALLKGANILRVHDVVAAKEVIQLMEVFGEKSQRND